jgi:hypothetical protein
VDKVFVSSAMRGFEAEREVVRQAIESLGLRALMAETSPASPDPSKHALLPLVEQADAVVLVLGARYGFVAEHGLAPTEDEYDHAVKTGTPVLAFIQQGVEREPQQDALVAKVRGGWGHGAFTGSFSSPNELLLGVVKALANLQAAHRGGDAQPVAQARAVELATESDRSEGAQGGSIRTVMVPVGAGTLIDALVLEDASLGDRCAAVMRAAGLVSQAAGIDAQSSSRGLDLRAKAPEDFHTTVVTMAADGSVRVVTEVRADGSMGSMAISYPRVEQVLGVAGEVAQALWALLPDGDRVRQVAATACVPDANYHPLILSGQVGGRSMGMPTLPSPLVAPYPPLIVPRADVGTDALTRRLAVSVKQAFADHGAVQP